MGTKYALYPGCMVLARLPSYELSTRKVCEIFNIELVDMKDTSCCAPIGIASLDYLTALTISARNLCIAEELGLDILTLCSGCYETLKKSNETLKTNKELRGTVNEALKDVGRHFRGTVNVRHIIDMFYRDTGVKRIYTAVKRPLEGFKVGVYYGCHLLKPSSVLKFDDPEKPKALDELVGATAAESVPYRRRLECCGGLLRGISDEIASKLVFEKLTNLKKASLDCVVTACPFCFIQLDLGQLEMARKFKGTDVEEPLPVLHYPELLGLSLGFDAKELGAHTHRTSVQRIIEKLKGLPAREAEA